MSLKLLLSFTDDDNGVIYDERFYFMVIQEEMMSQKILSRGLQIIEFTRTYKILLLFIAHFINYT